MTIKPALPTHAAPQLRRPQTPQTQEQIAKSAQDFTAVALGEMLSPLFNTLKQDGGLFGGGEGEAAWRPMMVQEMAKSMAKNGGLGITTLVTQAMLRLQESGS